MNKLKLLETLITKNIPVYVHYGITHRCNLKCRMCGVWKTGNKNTELTTRQIFHMAEVLAQLGTQVISIGGGEPLIREDIVLVVKAFIDKGISVRILTNGVISHRERLEQVMEAGVSNFSISLDTLDEKLQDDIIAMPGAFAKVMETFYYLAPLLKKNKGLGIINTVVSSANLHTLTEMIEFAENLEFYVSFVPLELHQFSGKILGCNETMSDLNFSKEDRATAKRVFNQLVQMKKQGRNIFNSSTFLKSAGKYLAGEPFDWNCLAGTLYFSVSPEGRVSLCHRYLGYTEEGNEWNITDPDFIRVFRSKKYRDSVQDIQRRCRACLRPCWAEISNLFTDPTSLMEMVKIQTSRELLRQ